MTKSLSMVTMKTNETTDKFMKKTKSLRALRGKRKHSNEENIDKSTTPPPSSTEEKRPKIDDVKEPLEEAATTKDPNLPASSISIQETALAKFAGVKNMLSSAVWGVPYAKVVEDPLEISVMDEPEVEVEGGKVVADDAELVGVAVATPGMCHAIVDWGRGGPSPGWLRLVPAVGIVLEEKVLDEEEERSLKKACKKMNPYFLCLKKLC